MDADVIIIGSGAGGGTLAAGAVNSAALLLRSGDDAHPNGLANASGQVGTLRFGADPMQSVFDPNCRSHELDNLYVADASFMPSISAVNPSLTIMANALRMADILRHHLAGAA